MVATAKNNFNCSIPVYVVSLDTLLPFHFHELCENGAGTIAATGRNNIRDGAAKLPKNLCFINSHKMDLHHSCLHHRTLLLLVFLTILGSARSRFWDEHVSDVRQEKRSNVARRSCRNELEELRRRNCVGPLEASRSKKGGVCVSGRRRISIVFHSVHKEGGPHIQQMPTYTCRHTLVGNGDRYTVGAAVPTIRDSYPCKI